MPEPNAVAGEGKPLQKGLQVVIATRLPEVGGQVKNKQEPALKEDGFPKSPQALRLFLGVFSTLYQIGTAQHVPYVQPGIEQEDFLYAMLLIDALGQA